MTEDPRIDDAVETLKVLLGLPPHNTWSNISYADGYAYKAYERRFPKWIRAEAQRKIDEGTAT